MLSQAVRKTITVGIVAVNQAVPVVVDQVHAVFAAGLGQEAFRIQAIHEVIGRGDLRRLQG